MISYFQRKFSTYAMVDNSTRKIMVTEVNKENLPN